MDMCDHRDDNVCHDGRAHGELVGLWGIYRLGV